MELSDSSSSEDSSCDEEGCQQAPEEVDLDITALVHIAKSSDFNCFEIVTKLEESTHDEVMHIIHTLHEKCFELELTAAEISKLEVCFSAFLKDMQSSGMRLREVRAINDEIVTDSESDDPSQYISLQDVLSPTGLELMKMHQKTIQWRAQRSKVKAVVEQKVLSRKHSQKVRRILAKHPDIGQKIEEFVKDRGVGADAWR